MRKYAIPLIISFLAMVIPAFAQATHKTYRIAILEFDPVTSEAAKDNLGRVGAEFLITAAVNSGSFAVVERAAIKKVLDEMQFGQGSNAPATAAQAIGSMVGAQGVLTGSVAKTGNSVRLDARLIDVASGNIVAARSAYAKSDLRSIATAAELLVSQLEGDLSRLTPPAPKPEPKSELKPEPKTDAANDAAPPAQPAENTAEKQSEKKEQPAPETQPGKE